jgi:hypothetical protein
MHFFAVSFFLLFSSLRACAHKVAKALLLSLLVNTLAYKICRIKRLSQEQCIDSFPPIISTSYIE